MDLQSHEKKGNINKIDARPYNMILEGNSIFKRRLDVNITEASRKCLIVL